MRELAAHFLTLAEKQGAVVPLMVGHRNMGVSLLHTGDIQEARVQIDRAIVLYDPAKHRQLATRDLGKTFGWHSCSIDRWPCGRLAIQREHLQRPTARSEMRARSAKLPV